MNPQNPNELEKFIHQTLRSLPDRKAPEALMRRVNAAIAARELRPWWEKGYSAWPAFPRMAFLAVSACVVGLFLYAGTQLFGGASPTEVLARIGGGDIAEAVLVTRSAALDVFRAIPPLWLYGLLICFAALYAAIFGAGAVVYRTLTHARN